MRHPYPFIACVFVLASNLAFPTVGRGDWPNFRGPRHDGISSETGLKTRWQRPPSPVWEREIGSAFSSFAAVGDRIYTCGTANGKQVLYCLNAETGAVLWQTPYEEQFKSQFGDGTRATPTVDGDRVYILGAQGTLLCADAKTGKDIWKKEFHHSPTWAYSGSVLIEGDLAIASAGSDEGSLVAFDKKTGRLKWRCGSDPVGYATPYPFTFDGQRYVAGFTGNSLILAEARTGRQVYRRQWKTDWGVNAASPIYQDGHLWVGSGYKTGCGLLKLRREGENLTADTVWQSKVIMSKFQSPVLHDGNLYTSDQKALVCVDFLTGQERWRKRRIKHGTVMVADGKLLLLTEGGELRIAEAQTNGFEPTATAEIFSDRCWTVPVLHRGRLYARNLKRMLCLDLRNGAGARGLSESPGTKGR